MHLPYAYTPQIWPSLLTLLFLLAIFMYSSRRRSVPGVLPFLAGCLFSAAWTAGSVMEYAAIDPGTKIFWIKFQATCQLPAATTATCFVLEYAWPGRWLTRRNLILLSIAPVLVLGLILTDTLHHFIWLDFRLDGTAVTQVLGLGTWLTILYSFLLVILSLTVFTWLFLHSPQHRWPVAMMVIGHVGLRSIYVLERADLIHSVLPLDVIGLGFMALMYALALFAFRIFDPIPLARQTTVEQLRDGMLVLDTQGRLVGLNPAAERILTAPLQDIRGKLVEEILPNLPELNSPLVDAVAHSKPMDITFGSGVETRCYELEFSRLDDFRGLSVGRLLLLHDVTEQRRSQAQLLEQQRALSMLQEREQLARELHDGLGQELAAAHLQASTARLLLDRGETTQIGDYLNLLAGTTLQAEADLREYLLGAQSSVSVDHPFFDALREYLNHFTRLYSLPVELSVLPELEGQDLPQTLALQLLRIIQEGLSNIRKHAHARCAQVCLTLSGASLQVMISDDGLGFNPSAVTPQPGAGFGLRSMRERAEGLGGALKIDSTPGKGTRVVVEIPVNGSPAANRKQ
jgi:signal transduction histidine kinase